MLFFFVPFVFPVTLADRFRNCCLVKSSYLILTSSLLCPCLRHIDTLYKHLKNKTCPGNHQHSSRCCFLIPFVFHLTSAYRFRTCCMMKSSYLIVTSLLLFSCKAHRHTILTLYEMSVSW